jgi:hypothetical protein
LILLIKMTYYLITAQYERISCKIVLDFFNFCVRD